MNIDLSSVDLVTEASLVVQFVMLVLLLASLCVGTVVYFKRKELKQALFITDEFEVEFWSGGELTELYRKLTVKEFHPEGVEKIFLSGYNEFSRMRQKETVEPHILVESAERAMRIELTRELASLHDLLPFLTIVASTSLYLGWFGAVWEMLSTFRLLLNDPQLVVANLLPGLVEALVVIAIALLATLVAHLAAQYFSMQLKQLVQRYELFIDEFIILLQRLAYSK